MTSCDVTRVSDSVTSPCIGSKQQSLNPMNTPWQTKRSAAVKVVDQMLADGRYVARSEDEQKTAAIIPRERNPETGGFEHPTRPSKLRRLATAAKDFIQRLSADKKSLAKRLIAAQQQIESMREPRAVDTVQKQEAVTCEVSNCSVCKKRPASVMLKPCEHISMCSNCTETLMTCPLCRTRIDSYLYGAVVDV